LPDWPARRFGPSPPVPIRRAARERRVANRI
jgi:hypothetical protein